MLGFRNAGGWKLFDLRMDETEQSADFYCVKAEEIRRAARYAHSSEAIGELPRYRRTI
jgi:hypothetical protein